jgi:hypothetical protein
VTIPLVAEGVKAGSTRVAAAPASGADPSRKTEEVREEEESSQKVNTSGSRESPFRNSHLEMRIDTPSFSINSMQNEEASDGKSKSANQQSPSSQLEEEEEPFNNKFSFQ